MRRVVLLLALALGLALTLTIAALAARALTRAQVITLHWTSDDGVTFRRRSAILVTGTEQFMVSYRVERGPVTRAGVWPETPPRGLAVTHFVDSPFTVAQWVLTPSLDVRLARLGFGYADGPATPPRQYPMPGARGFRLAVPVWFLILLCSTLTAVVFWRLGEFGRRARIARGLCPICGYDLRGANHERCPECGEPVEDNLPHGGAALQRRPAPPSA